jgi:type II pantothenate kinase
MNKTAKKPDTKKLVTAGILSALIIVMTIVPYTGYINYGLVEITTLHIVVAIGAVMLGWQYGGILGGVWGVTCVLRALTNPLWAPFLNPLISVVPRICVGIVAGLVAEGLRKLNCKSYFVGGVSAAAATVTNTVLVLSAMKMFSTLLEGAPLFGTIYTTLIGVNGVIELIAAVLIVPAVIRALQPREMVLGVDMGASTTKLAIVRNGRCVRTLRKADDETLEEALERIGTEGVTRVAVTGVGSTFEHDRILGLPTAKVDEFTSLARGAAACSGKHNFLVASIGTGTSFTRVTPFRAYHAGGTGLGGGLLKAMSHALLDIQDMEQFQKMASKGSIGAIDLQIRDVCEGTISDLQPETTVANFAKWAPDAKPEDVAAGICNLVFQNIGLMGALQTKTSLTRTVVLVGTITDWPNARTSLDAVAALHNVHFIVPEHAPFATAIGAALV